MVRKNIQLPLVDKANEVVGALFAIILLATIFVFPFSLRAENVYYQDNPSSEFDFVIGDFVSNRAKIGEFTTSQLRDFNSGIIQYSVKESGSSCGPSPWFYITIATSTSALTYSDQIDLEVSYQDITSNLTEVSAMLADTYNVYATISCNFGSSHIYIKSNYTPEFYGLIADSGGVSEVLNNTSTRIYYLDPVYNETVASGSVSLEADSYVNSSDFSSDMYLRLRYVRQQDLQQAVSNQDLLWTTIDFPTLSEGGSGALSDLYNFISTSTTISNEGVYYYTAEIRKQSFISSILNWFGLDSFYDPALIVSTSSRFIVGQPTAFDNFVASTTEALVVNNATSTAQVSSDCNPLSFSLVGCLDGLFGFQSVPDAFLQMRDTFLVYAPFGYLTRFAEILSDPATTTLPSLSYTFPSSAPAFLSNAEFTFNPWQYFYVDGSPLKDEIVANDGSGDNIWDIMEPIISILVYLTLIFMVVNDLIKIHPKHKDL